MRNGRRRIFDALDKQPAAMRSTRKPAVRFGPANIASFNRRQDRMNAITEISGRRPLPLALGEHLAAFGCVGPEAARPIDAAARAMSWAARLADRSLGRSRAGAATVAPDLEDLIRRMPTGGWSIGPDTARVLATLFDAVRPRLVLEFGSGSSTVLFAALCARMDEGARVVSLDETETFATRTRGMLNALGLSQRATIVVAPVVRRTIGDWTGRMYRPSEAAMRHALDGRRADLVFVDGPANWLGKRGDCRFGTLPAARAWANDGAVFAADDALRPRDLEIVRRWGNLSFVDIEGIIPLGRGLAVGRLRPA